MRYSKLYLFLFLALFLAINCANVLADDDLQVFKYGEGNTIVVLCQNAATGLQCSANATGNLTVYYPNGTLWIGVVPMTNRLDQFVYNVSASQTLIIGDYFGSASIADGAVGDIVPVHIKITPSGFIQSNSQALGSFSFLILMIVLTFIFAFGGSRLLNNKTLWVLGIFMLFISVLFVIYDVWLGYEYHRNFTGLADSRIPETIFYIFLYTFVLGLLVSVALLFLRWRELARYIKREIRIKKETRDELDELWDYDGMKDNKSKINREKL
jgi:hypothetical protein